MAAGRSKRKNKLVSAGELPIAPMIDMVFLLLVYFMVSSTLQKQEADLGFSLPAVLPQNEPQTFPDEQIIQIDEEGRATINGYAYDDPSAARYGELAKTLSRYQQASLANKTKARVTIAPSDQTPHEMVVKVMDACSMAQVSSVSFAVE